MELKLLMRSARSATLELADGGIYNTKETYQIFLNGVLAKETNQVITSVFGLKPETGYVVLVKNSMGETIAETSFLTPYEFVTLNVRDFGAKGDGVSDDTKFIQAAILSCPKNSRVLVPAGTI